MSHPGARESESSAAARCALQLEELGLNAWPALDQLHYSGYLLRFARGFSARSNSVHALYAGDTSRLDPALLELCEDIYRSRGLPAQFRMGPHTPLLDEALAARGYRRVGEALVMARALGDTADRKSQTDHGARAANAVHPGNEGDASMPLEDETPGLQMFMSERLDGSAGEHWLSAVTELHSRPAASIASFRELLSRIVTRSCYLLATTSQLTGGQRAAACALGVLQQNWVGIYELYRRSNLRGHGIGRAALRCVEDWARAYGATHAYLSCDALDRPALQVFQDAGYREMYRSWYRMQT